MEIAEKGGAEAAGLGAMVLQVGRELLMETSRNFSKAIFSLII
jgi:hypothetical protein